MKQSFIDMNFSNIIIPASHIFYQKKHVFSFVNLKPISKGHVLVCPTRSAKRYSNLNEIEAIELWIAVRNISSKLKKYYNTDTCSISLQDGDGSGQTIDHVHVHIIPLINNKLITSVDIDSKYRDFQEMANEANEYRTSLNL